MDAHIKSRIVSAEEARKLLATINGDRVCHCGTEARWHRNENHGFAEMVNPEDVTTPLLCDLAATVVRLHEERDQAQIAAADLIEIIGETAWGIQLPTLFVRGPIMLPDGTIGTNAIPTALAPESAKQLVEHLYERVKTGRGWLREARHERDEARRERDRLRDILACERGERAPEGWRYVFSESKWRREWGDRNEVRAACWRRWSIRAGASSYEWGFEIVYDERDDLCATEGTAPTALEAIEAADRVAKETK